MARDPYEVLGVSRTSSDNEIKKAYRKLAKKWHPDTNTDDPKAKERFAEATNAYDFLSDKEKRTQYDRGEIDAEGNPKFQGFEGFGRRAGAGAGASMHEGPGGMRWSYSSTGGGAGFGPEDVLGEIFGGRRGFAGAGRGRAHRPPTRGEDMPTTLDVDLVEAARGATKRVRLPSGREMDVRIPAGIETGKQIRLKEQGHRDPYGGPPGDVLITVNVRPHPDFKVEGHNLRYELDVPLADAVLGARKRVPTLEGAVEVKIPPWSNGGRTMRLKGKGLPKPRGGHGDLLVTLRVVLPEERDPELEELMRRQRGD